MTQLPFKMRKKNSMFWIQYIVNYLDDVATLGFYQGWCARNANNFNFLAHNAQEKRPLLEVNDYHLIFDLHGVLVDMGEGQIKIRLVVFRLGIKEFLSTYVEKIMVYMWSLAMKRNFLRHLEIIIEKTSICLPSCRIMD